MPEPESTIRTRSIATPLLVIVCVPLPAKVMLRGLLVIVTAELNVRSPNIKNDPLVVNAIAVVRAEVSIVPRL